MLALNLDVMLSNSGLLNIQAWWILEKEPAIPNGSEDMPNEFISLRF